MPLHKKEILELGNLVRVYAKRERPVLPPDKQVEVLKNPMKIQQIVDIVGQYTNAERLTTELCEQLLDKLEDVLNTPPTDDDTPDD